MDGREAVPIVHFAPVMHRSHSGHLWNSPARATLHPVVSPGSMNQPHSIAHPRDPLHGVTLEMIVTTLVVRHGWAKLGARVPIRCFRHHPTIQSSLTFLRKTPWARTRVEQIFVAELPERSP